MKQSIRRIAIVAAMAALCGAAPAQQRGTVVLPANADDVVLDWPIAGTPNLNSQFGPRQLGSAGARYDFHRGTDLRMPIGTDILAPADAIVVFSGNHPGFQDPVIQLRHNTVQPYLYTLYLHMSGTSTVAAGQTVARGTKIGESGQGSASYPHLHWEVRLGCLNQVCCHNVYGWLDYPSTPPSPPVLSAAGDSPALGRMALVFWSFPKDELDFEEIEVVWGDQVRRANLDEMNALTPTGNASALDDPLFFFEQHGAQFAVLPKRFNDTFPSMDYEFLAWGFAQSEPSGMATVKDSSGLTASAPLDPSFPPISVLVSQELSVLEPGAPFSFTHTVTNTDTVPRTMSFSAISAQSLTLTVSPTGATALAGASFDVTVSGTLSSAFPEGIGDIILLKTTVSGGSWTPYLSGTLIDTSTNPPARVSEWMGLR